MSYRERQGKDLDEEAKSLGYQLMILGRLEKVIVMPLMPKYKNELEAQRMQDMQNLHGLLL